MLNRALISVIRESAKKFPVVGIVGPRQSGKTTIAKVVFPQYRYVNLEELDNRRFAQEDPRRFLETYSNQVIIDEVQRVPELFSYLQAHVDKSNQSGQLVLTGSQHFLLMESVSQSLAGRISLQTLLPLSFAELKSNSINFGDYSTYLFRGTYPRVFDKNLTPKEWYPSYFQTYIERDIRALKNITDLSAFEKFVRLCAGRVGQILNLSSLAADIGITHNTAKAWLSVLEASFIVFILQPHHVNFSKRLIKSPKLYFVDVGLSAWLLGIETEVQLRSHYLLGNLFENWVVIEYSKYRYNQGLLPNGYFWRDQSGHELDLLVEQGNGMMPIEIKAGKTVNSDYFENLRYWQSLAGIQKGRLIFGGETSQKRSDVEVWSWEEMEKAFV